MTTLSKSKICTTLVVASLALVSGSAALQAQDQTMRSRVNIPFAFEVGSIHFAPGTYLLTQPREHVLSIQGPSRGALAMSRREASLSPSAKGKIVFDRYGDRYFLREVWLKGKTDHLLCPESKAEAGVKKTLQAANQASAATAGDVEIALLDSPR